MSDPKELNLHPSEEASCSHFISHLHQTKKDFMNNSMDFGRVVFATIGFSTSLVLFVPNVKKWHRQQVTTEKLRIITEALEHAEERAAKFQERHDRMLNQMCSFYLTNKELEEALASARAAANDALDFATQLRRM
ncbi:hypothetical protein ACLB2K_060877 [Fragaria x ananassa]